MIDEGINPDNCKHLFIYGTPRGATNLFCALLHNHPNIAAINHKSTRKFLNHLLENGHSTSSEWIFNKDDFIYEKGGPAKSYPKISHLVFDKVHWASDRTFQHIGVTLSRIQAGLADGIVLIRHPVKVLKSMHMFHQRYNRPRWALTPLNVARYLIQYFLPQLWLLKIEGMHGIVVEEFVKNLPYSYRAFCDRYGLPFQTEFTDFRTTFNLASTWTGGKFITKKCQVEGGGSFLTSKGIKAPAQKIYFDPISSEPTWGYGQFNPALPLEPERLIKTRCSPDHATQKIIKRVFCHSIPRQNLDYLLETEILDIEELRKFEIGGIGKAVFKLLFNFPLPKWIGKSWKQLRAQPY